MKIFYQIILIFILLLQGCNKTIPPQKIEIPASTNSIEKFGFLKNITKENNKYFATVDFIDYLKNSEIDSTVSENQKIELPNDYSYVNKKIKIEKIAISDSAKLILQTFSYDSQGNFNFNQSVGLNEIIKAFQESKNNIFLHSPFKIKIKNNQIIPLNEIYIP
jgi:hypothetical protein